MTLGSWIKSIVLIALVVGTGGALAAWKSDAIARDEAASRSLPEPMESITVATAKERRHVHTATAIGTVSGLIAAAPPGGRRPPRGGGSPASRRSPP